MQITIQVNDNGTVSATSGIENTTQSPGIASADKLNDGGASKSTSGGTEGSSTTSSGNLDIGAPPQWLSDALGKDQKSDEANASPGATGENDGGGAPD